MKYGKNETESENARKQFIINLKIKRRSITTLKKNKEPYEDPKKKLSTK